MSATFQEIVEVPFDSVRELKKGLVTHRNKFCDVRLWVENHAIPAHKLILSLHSTFFEQMFKSEPESASEGMWKKHRNFVGNIFSRPFIGNAKRYVVTGVTGQSA